jgi:hypothetical protein
MTSACGVCWKVVFKLTPRTVSNLEGNIIDEIVTVPPAMLAATFSDVDHCFSRQREINFHICNQVIFTHLPRQVLTKFWFDQ